MMSCTGSAWGWPDSETSTLVPLSLANHALLIRTSSRTRLPHLPPPRESSGRVDLPLTTPKNRRNPEGYKEEERGVQSTIKLRQCR